MLDHFPTGPGPVSLSTAEAACSSAFMAVGVGGIYASYKLGAALGGIFGGVVSTVLFGNLFFVAGGLAGVYMAERVGLGPCEQ